MEGVSKIVLTLIEPDRYKPFCDPDVALFTNAKHNICLLQNNPRHVLENLTEEAQTLQDTDKCSVLTHTLVLFSCLLIERQFQDLMQP